MVYTVYKTTNVVNNKYYVGVHKTNDPNDSYLGSGERLKKAISKYGRRSFKKEILATFETADEAYAKEAEIVNEKFVLSPMTYNIHVGGFGKGIEVANALGLNNKGKGEEHKAKMKDGFERWKNSDRCPKKKFSDAQLLEAYNEHGSVRKAMTSLGAGVSGATAKRLISLLKRDPNWKPCKPGPKKIRSSGTGVPAGL